jgi:hypothetical protein
VRVQDRRRHLGRPNRTLYIVSSKDADSFGLGEDMARDGRGSSFQRVGLARDLPKASLPAHAEHYRKPQPDEDFQVVEQL